MLIHFRADAKSSIRFCASNQLYDHSVIFQWAASPVSCDMAEHSMFDLIPFAGARWIVANFDDEAGLVGKLLQFQFPEAASGTVATSTVRSN